MPYIVAARPTKMAMTGTLKATEDKGVYLIKATRVGAHAYTWDGYALAWTLEALQDCAESWTFGTVSVNHNGKSYGTIESSWFEDPFVYMKIKVNDELDGWIARNIGDGGVGVSIEADLVEADYNALSILKARGTGVAVVLYPERPACSSEEGCGIVAADNAGGAAVEAGTPDTDIVSMKDDIKIEAGNMVDVVENKAPEMDEKLTAAIAEKERLAARVAELEAANAAMVAKEKETILASIGDKVGDLTAYKDMKVCELRLAAKVIADYEAVLDRVSEVSSGAEGDAILATETPIPKEKEQATVEATLKDVEARTGIKLT